MQMIYTSFFLISFLIDHSSRHQKGIHMETKEAHAHLEDVAIIGAGIAGSCAAWRLREAGLKITLYEYSDRIGGRCHTVKFPDIPDISVELGAMRFYPSDHVLLKAAISELGLHAVDFKPAVEKKFYLRGKHLTEEQLPEHAPYQLKPEHRKTESELKWEIFSSFTNVDPSIEGYKSASRMLQYQTPDGIPLYKQSQQAFNNKFLYPEVVSYMVDMNGLNGIYDDVSASKSLPLKASAPGTAASTSTVQTIEEGFQALPENMVKGFLECSSKHSYKQNHHLLSIVKHEDGHYQLTFEKTQTVRGVTTSVTDSDRIRVRAKTVFLAIPKMALQHLDWTALKEPMTADYLKNSLYEAKAGKIYSSYNNPWWREFPHSAPSVYSTTPLRTTRDFGDSNINGHAILNDAYQDLYTLSWRNILKQGKPVPGIGDDSMQMTDVAQDMTRKYLAEIYGVSLSDIPKPNHSIMKIWDEYPIGASWYYYRPGYIWSEVGDYMLKPSKHEDVFIISNTFTMSQIMKIWDEYPIGASWYYYRPGYIWSEVGDHMLKPSKHDDVFIISNTFSSKANQAWVEGALELVETVLKSYFPLINSNKS